MKLINKKSQSGFSLVSVVIGAGIMSALTVGFSSFMVQQFENISYLEDKVSHANLKEFFVKEFKNNSSLCDSILVGETVGTTKSDLIIQDSTGKKIFDPADPNASTYEQLKITRVYLEDVDTISGGTGFGDIKIVMNVERQRGSGIKELRSVEVMKRVSTVSPTDSEITSCFSGAKSGIPDCVYQSYKTHNTSSVYGSFVVPNDTSVFSVNGIVIYPGITKVGGKILEKGKVLAKTKTGTSKYDHKTQSGNQYWKSGDDWKIKYDGVTLMSHVYSTAPKSASSPPSKTTVNYPSTSIDTVPMGCGRVNSASTSVSGNMGAKLYSTLQD